MPENSFYSSGRAPIHDVSPEQFDFREVKSQDTLGRPLCREDGIHLPEIQFVSMAVLKIFVGTSHKDFTIRDLSVVGLSLLKLNLSFEVDISGK